MYDLSYYNSSHTFVHVVIHVHVAKSFTLTVDNMWIGYKWMIIASQHYFNHAIEISLVVCETVVKVCIKCTTTQLVVKLTHKI